jgi:leucyl-tRNA synthetase
MDPDNDEQGWDKEKEKYWMGDKGVDLYIGGAEHAVLHLLYSRFWHKVLYDLGYVSTKEPFHKLINQGMILGLSYRDSRGVLVPNDLVIEKDTKYYHKETNEELEEFSAKMSKSLKNVVNPDDVIARYGSDSMRLYEMFMGPLEATKPWNTQGVEGVFRFLQKAWRTVIDEDSGQLADAVTDAAPDADTAQLLHKTIKKVTEDIENYRFNTAISAMMIFVNHLSKQPERPKEAIKKFLLLLAPFAPHVAEELWSTLGNDNTLAYEPWPEYDPELVKESQIELAVQIKGKIKDRIVVVAGATEEQIKEKALASEKVIAAMDGKTPKKIIVIKSRLVNIVV